MESKNKKTPALYVGGAYFIVGVVAVNTVEHAQNLASNSARTASLARYFKIDKTLCEEESVMPGSVVVTDDGSLSVGCITSIEELNFSSPAIVQMHNSLRGWVVDVVSLTDQIKRKEATARKEAIMTHLAERREQLEELSIYEMLAQTDAESAKLLNELKTLGD